MTCVFCRGSEAGPVEATVCGTCVQKLLTASQAELKAAYDLAIEKGLTDKVEALESFIKEEGYVPKARKIRPGLERARPVRTSRSARYQIRA